MWDVKVAVNRVILILLFIGVVVSAALYVIQTNAMYKNSDVLQQSLSASEHIQVKLQEENELLVSKNQQLASEKDQLTAVKDVLDAEIVGLKSELVQVQELLDQAQQENMVLQSEKDRLGKKLALLKEDLRLWEGKIVTLSEKKLVKQRRIKGIRELTRRIKNFRIKAQRQIDRIKSELGNRGYIIKDGKTTYTPEKAIELEKIIIRRPALEK